MGGFWSRSETLDPEKDLVDLTGKVALITGGGAGIGYGTAQVLARRGAKVYIIGRNERRTLDAIAQLEKEGLGNKGGSVDWIQVDLADPKSAKNGAEEFLKKETRLDILINNAALGAVGPYKLTDDGVLDVMAINHLSHFVLTRELLPLLKRTSEEPDSDVRIINLSSLAHQEARDVDSFLGGKEVFTRSWGDSWVGHLRTYGYSKLANILHINELQHRLASTHPTITCISVHPGPVWTPGSRQFAGSVPYLGPLIARTIATSYFVPVAKGATTSIVAAAAKRVRESRDAGTYKAAYLIPYGKIGKSSKLTQGELGQRLAKELWETTEKVLEEIGV